MSKNEIIDILPTPLGERFEKLKNNNPYKVILCYVDAIDEKYQKLSSNIRERSETNDSYDAITKINYSFYITAPIGRGYFYKLFEVKADEKTAYPVEIKFFKNTVETETAKTAKELDEKLIHIFKSDFTLELFFNLIAQVELIEERERKNTNFVFE